MNDFITNALAGNTSSKNPVAVVLMGGPGSGKSSATRGMDLDGFVSVDPDGVKAAMPRYQELVAAGNPDAASLCHAESSQIAISIRDAAIAGKYNMVLDGTGRNLAKMERAVKALRTANYTIRLVFVDVPVGIGLARATARAATTGRVVPTDVIRAAYAVIPGNFDALKGSVDEYARFDNSGRAAVLVETNAKSAALAA